MQRCGRAEVHQFHVRVRQHFLQLRVNLHVGSEVDVVGFLDVAGHALEHAIDGQADGVADGDDPRALRFEVSAQVGDTHESKADDANIHGSGIL